MRTFLRPLCLMALLPVLTAQMPANAAPRLVDLHNFGVSGDGNNPNAAPTPDPHGNLFGPTQGGGTGPCTLGCGTIYELSPVGDGSYTESILYDFQDGSDGASPRAALSRDRSGAFYGTAYAGKFSEDSLVYRLAPPSSGGSWSFSTLYLFDHTTGVFLNADQPLIVRGKGAFGLTQTSSGGTLFELTPPKSGHTSWNLHTRFTFSGASPTSIAAAPHSHAIYATFGKSIVSLAPSGAGNAPWTEAVLFSFKDGNYPSGLVTGDDGTIYGTANAVVFSLAETAPGVWTETDLYRLHRWWPSSLLPARDGTVLGIVSGDPDFFQGNLFRLSPPDAQGGAWTYTQILAFRRAPSGNPVGIAFDRSEHIFGTLNDEESSALFTVKGER